MLKKAYGHNNIRSLPWVGWLDNGSKALSTNSHQTIVWNTKDYRNPDKWEIIFKLNDNFFPLNTCDRQIVAVIHSR